jgi:transcriptional regulator with XRE-family HTH domain
MQTTGNHDFATELRTRRLAAALSLSALSRLVHYSKSHLSKVENRLKIPSPDLARRCDAQLGADGALAAMVPDRRGADVPPAAESAALWTMGLGPDGRSEFAGGRFPVASLGVATTFSWMLQPTVPPRHTRDTTIPAFQAMLGEMRRLGQTMAPGALLPVLVAQTNALRVMAPQATADERDKLLLLAARYAEYAGWMAQEAGSDEAAMWWTDQSCEMSETAGYPDLAAYALVRQALIAMYRADSRSTVLLARLAQEQTCIPRIVGLAALREAQGHALANNLESCLRALDLARDRLDAAVLGDEPIIGTSSVSDPVTMAHAWCLFDLGRPAESAEMFAAQLPSIPAHAHRARARFSARFALALAAIGEADDACVAAARVIDTLSRAESATIRHDLRRLAFELGRSPRSSGVRDFMPRLHDALRMA